MFRRFALIRCSKASSSTAAAAASAASAAAASSSSSSSTEQQQQQQQQRQQENEDIKFMYASPSPSSEKAVTTTAAAGDKSKNVVKSELAQWQENHLARVGRTLDQVLNGHEDDEISTLPVVATLSKPLAPIVKPKKWKPADETPSDPPPRTPTPRWVLTLAADHHKGTAVYRTRKEVVAVLQALRVSKPVWWCEHCDDVLARLLAIQQRPVWDLSQKKGAIITVDGLDAVGKTTVTRNLASEENNFAKKGYFGDGTEEHQRHEKRVVDRCGENDAELSAEGKSSEKKRASSGATFEEELHTRIPGAVLLRTPSPELEAARQKFRVLEDPIARVFYCAANYLAADEVMSNAQERVVVLDRWWYSTAAMALAIRSKHLVSLESGAMHVGAASQYKAAGSDMMSSVMPNAIRGTKEEEELEQMVAYLPQIGAECYEWPVDLPAVDLSVLLDCDEDTRLGRMAKRGDENAEERELREKAALRDTAREAFARMYPPLETVMVPNYAAAVNTIIDLLEQRCPHLLPRKPKRFDQEFVDSLPPF